VPYGIQQSSQKNVMAAHRLENHDAWNTARSKEQTSSFTSNVYICCSTADLLTENVICPISARRVLRNGNFSMPKMWQKVLLTPLH